VLRPQRFLLKKEKWKKHLVASQGGIRPTIETQRSLRKDNDHLQKGGRTLGGGTKKREKRGRSD